MPVRLIGYGILALVVFGFALCIVAGALKYHRSCRPPKKTEGDDYLGV